MRNQSVSIVPDSDLCELLLDHLQVCVDVLRLEDKVVPDGRQSRHEVRLLAALLQRKPSYIESENLLHSHKTERKRNQTPMLVQQSRLLERQPQ